MENQVSPIIIAAGVHTDVRGTLKYFNDLDLSPIKRFYISEHPDVTVVKAWQGHQCERKWFYVTAGAFKVVLIRPDNWEHPSQTLEPKEFNMNFEQNGVLCVPAGYATGFQAVTPNSNLMIFSDFTLEESLEDDFRFDKHMWYNW